MEDEDVSAVRYVLAKIYGDGDPDVLPENLTPTTGPFRAAVNDIDDPSTGARAFEWRGPIKTQAGVPVAPWGVFAVSGNKHGLYKNNPDVLPFGEPGMKGARIAAHGINDGGKMLSDYNIVADFGGSQSFTNENTIRDYIEHAMKLHDPEQTIDDLDF